MDRGMIRPRARPLALAPAVLALGVILGGCSTARSMPSAFEAMASSEVGCVVDFAGAEYEVGPLGPSDAETVEPNPYTSFRIGRTAQHVVLAVDTARSEANSHFLVSDLSADGVVVLWGAFEDGGNPGYEIRCWGSGGER